jgi:glutamyl-tRNA reductase
MSVIVVGVSHHASDLDLLERVAIPADDRRKVLHELVALDHVLEASVLSTCNRVEVYVHVSRFHPGLDEVTGWFGARAGDRRGDFLDQSYVHFDEGAARHLFAVSAGIDSLIVGERQIAIQVKQAMEDARGEGTARRMLQRLFRQAIQVGRRARRETDISQGASSMVDVGLDLVARRLGGLGGRTALIVGAGKIGGLSAERLASDACDVVVWNRSDDKATRLAGRVAGRSVGSLSEGLIHADLVVCTTGAPEPVITRDLVAAVGPRGERELVMLDLAMPRNVEPTVDDLDGVTIIDIADVRDLAHERATGPAIETATGIVEDEAGLFSAWLSAIEVEPTIRALRSRADRVRTSELQRMARRLAGLDDEQREAVDALLRGVVNTFLHEPTIRLKELADAGGADVAADVLRELFDLDEGLGD